MSDPSFSIEQILAWADDHRARRASGRRSLRAASGVAGASAGRAWTKRCGWDEEDCSAVPHCFNYLRKSAAYGITRY